MLALGHDGRGSNKRDTPSDAHVFRRRFSQRLAVAWTWVPHTVTRRDGTDRMEPIMRWWAGAWPFRDESLEGAADNGQHLGKAEVVMGSDKAAVRALHQLPSLRPYFRTIKQSWRRLAHRVGYVCLARKAWRERFREWRSVTRWSAQEPFFREPVGRPANCADGPLHVPFFWRPQTFLGRFLREERLDASERTANDVRCPCGALCQCTPC